MRLKLTILTILVAFLTFLSFYGVFGQRGRGNDLAAASLAQETEASQTRYQTAYVLPLVQPNYWPIRNSDWPEPVLNAKAFLLYDTRNGRVLWSKDAQKTLPVASLTKLLTAVIVEERLDPQLAVKIEKESSGVDGESVDFRAGEVFLAQDLLGALLVKSSNDAAIALARAVERQTKKSFTDLMNQKALDLGLNDSRFLDPAGLNDAAFSSAEDLLRLTLYSKRFPAIWFWLRQPSWQAVSIDSQFSRSFSSTNRLLESWPSPAPVIVGGKTGYTDGALGCMLLEVELPETGSSLLAIVLGSTSRFEDIRTLIEWGAKAFRWR